MLAQVCAMIAGTMGGVKKPKIGDYLLFAGKRRKKQTGPEMLTWAKAIAAMSRKREDGET